MLGWGPATKIYLAAGATDMRKGFEGLYGLVRNRLELEPLSGHVFLFSNAQRNRLKLLFWDGSGLWVCAKRLEKGRFGWPAPESGQLKVVLSHEELALLLGGIELAGSKRRAWFRRIVSEHATPDTAARNFFENSMSV
jgi:transposase